MHKKTLFIQCIKHVGFYQMPVFLLFFLFFVLCTLLTTGCIMMWCDCWSCPPLNRIVQWFRVEALLEGMFHFHHIGVTQNSVAKASASSAWNQGAIPTSEKHTCTTHLWTRWTAVGCLSTWRLYKGVKIWIYLLCFNVIYELKDDVILELRWRESD